MNRWLLLLALVPFVLAGCDDKKKSGDDDDNDDESAETKEDDKGKAKDDGKPKVFVDCSEAGPGSYSKAAKTSEAKNGIGAITRGAMAAFERERAVGDDPMVASHALCKSATPVPAGGPPKGVKYQPQSTEGQDYETGDAETGWKCLKFAMSRPQHYQYGYNAGSGYKSTEFGLPDPGPDGFEAWAMGDLDGDGRPSLYVRTGKVDKATQRVKPGTRMSCVDPFE